MKDSPSNRNHCPADSWQKRETLQLQLSCRTEGGKGTPHHVAAGGRCLDPTGNCWRSKNLSCRGKVYLSQRLKMNDYMEMTKLII